MYKSKKTHAAGINGFLVLLTVRQNLVQETLKSHTNHLFLGMDLCKAELRDKKD